MLAQPKIPLNVGLQKCPKDEILIKTSVSLGKVILLEVTYDKDSRNIFVSCKPDISVSMSINDGFHIGFIFFNNLHQELLEVQWDREEKIFKDVSNKEEGHESFWKDVDKHKNGLD